MKNCKEIENNLPLYLDNLLSDADKLAVEEHIKSCSYCSKVLVQLKITENLLNGLPEVDPPPWFKQKIMAGVREETERKSFVQKWFYPLRIKIPVQIFATVFIAVLVVYIYRSGEEKMKAVMPSSVPAPVMEVSKDQRPAQSQKVPETLTANVMKEKVAARKDTRDEKTAMYDMASGVAAPKTEGLKKGRSQDNVRSGAVDAARNTGSDTVPDITANRYASAPAKPMEQSVVKNEKQSNSFAGAALKEGITLKAKSVTAKTVIALHIADTDAAVGEVEKLLTKYGAKNIVRQMPEGKAIVTAELKIQNLRDLITQLKIIGRTEERILSVDNADGNISVVIEILNH